MSNSVADDGSVRYQSVFALSLPRWSTLRLREHDLRSLRDTVVERCAAAVFPTLVNDPIFMESLALSVEENVQALRDVIVGSFPIGEVPMENRLRFTSIEAQARVTQVAMQRSYRLSYFLQWQHWSQIIASSALSGRVSASEVGRAQQSLAAIVMAYADTVVSQLSQSFAGSEEALSRSRHHVRQHLVKELLGGDDNTLSPADLVVLDYSMESWHLAVLLPTVPASSAGALLGLLRTRVPFETSLAYSLRLESSVLWLGSQTRWTDDRVDALVEVLTAAGHCAFIGDTSAGFAGFRRSYQQAVEVESVTARADQGASSGPSAAGPGVAVVRYVDLQLEILLLQNPQLAREFVERELGPLAEDTVEASKLRATIEASFRFGSHVSAAEHLHLHEHSVRNRLQRAHDLLGSLQARRTEIQVALRLWRLLDHR